MIAPPGPTAVLHTPAAASSVPSAPGPRGTTAPVSGSTVVSAGSSTRSSGPVVSVDQPGTDDELTPVPASIVGRGSQSTVDVTSAGSAGSSVGTGSTTGGALDSRCPADSVSHASSEHVTGPAPVRTLIDPTELDPIMLHRCGTVVGLTSVQRSPATPTRTVGPSGEESAVVSVVVVEVVAGAAAAGSAGPTSAPIARSSAANPRRLVRRGVCAGAGFVTGPAYGGSRRRPVDRAARPQILHEVGAAGTEVAQVVGRSGSSPSGPSEAAPVLASTAGALVETAGASSGALALAGAGSAGGAPDVSPDR